MAPIEPYKRFGITPVYMVKHKGRELIPAGVNILDGQHIEEQELEEAILVIDKPELAINVNSPNELRLAEKFLKGKPPTRLPIRDSPQTRIITGSSQKKLI